MPLLKTINDYFTKKHNPILIDRDSDYESSIDKWSLIHVNEDNFYPDTYNFNVDLLHEFIHLDKLRTIGSTNGYGVPSGVNNYDHPVEKEIAKEVEEIMIQNCLVFRVLKKKLKSARFILKAE